MMSAPAVRLFAALVAFGGGVAAFVIAVLLMKSALA